MKKLIVLAALAGLCLPVLAATPQQEKQQENVERPRSEEAARPAEQPPVEPQVETTKPETPSVEAPEATTENSGGESES